MGKTQQGIWIRGELFAIPSITWQDRVAAIFVVAVGVVLTAGYFLVSLGGL